MKSQKSKEGKVKSTPRPSQADLTYSKLCNLLWAVKTPDMLEKCSHNIKKCTFSLKLSEKAYEMISFFSVGMQHTY